MYSFTSQCQLTEWLSGKSFLNALGCFLLAEQKSLLVEMSCELIFSLISSLAKQKGNFKGRKTAQYVLPQIFCEMTNISS
jgi:hypothetical protein